MRRSAWHQEAGGQFCQMAHIRSIRCRPTRDSLTLCTTSANKRQTYLLLHNAQWTELRDGMTMQGSVVVVCEPGADWFSDDKL